MSEADIDIAEFARAKPKLLALMLAESDKRIAAQVQVMAAADTRATGILTATIALAAAAFALAADKIGEAGDEPLFWAAGVFGMSAMASAVAAVWALWPTAIQVTGWSPRLFRTDFNKSMERISAEILALNQKKITENDTCSGELTRRARISLFLLAAAPVLGAAAAAIAENATWSVGAGIIILYGLTTMAVLVGGDLLGRP